MSNDLKNNRDPQLWDIAKRRAGFKSHLISYIIVNSLLWLLWLAITPHEHRTEFIPWPVWPLVGWGIGLVFHYVFAFIYPKENRIEKEYEKLVKESKSHTTH